VLQNCVSCVSGGQTEFYLVECQHLAGELSSIIQRSAHPVIDLRRVSRGMPMVIRVRTVLSYIICLQDKVSLGI
jgi:hypothetical protein